MEGARFGASEKGRHELNQPPARIIKTIFSGALIGALVLGSSAPGAHAQGLDHADSTLSQFRGNLTSASDIAAYDALTKRQRAELASYLNGETDPVSQLSTSEPHDPFAEVSAKKAGAWISAGKAIAECKVTVKRGAPTPWGQITWSTASRIQYVAGDGHGTRTSHGWR